MTTLFICPRCGQVSHHPRDREEQFCAACGYEGELEPLKQQFYAAVIPGLQPGQTDVISVHSNLVGTLTASKPSLRPGQTSMQAEGAQADAAAERSTPIPERGPDLKAEARGVVRGVPDMSVPYVVELVNGQGRVERTWLTRFETEDDPANSPCASGRRHEQQRAARLS